MGTDLQVAHDHTPELLSGLRNGEPSAIEAAYRAHHHELRAFAQRIVGERAAAEDLVHDVFVKLPDAMRRFRGESSLRAFLIGIAANHCARHVRAAGRRRKALARLQLTTPTRVACSVGIATGAVDVDALHRALDRLPLAQRAALILCEVEERTAAEAALILGVAEVTVRTRCFHARKKLLRLLGAEVRL